MSHTIHRVITSIFGLMDCAGLTLTVPLLAHVAAFPVAMVTAAPVPHPEAAGASERGSE